MPPGTDERDIMYSTESVAGRQRLRVDFMGETIVIEGCGPDGLRLRARPRPGIVDPAWSVIGDQPSAAEVEIDEDGATIRNGRIMAELRLRHRYGADVGQEVMIRYLRADTGEELLAEARPHFAGPGPRSYRPLASDSFRLEASFAAQDERLAGLGQHHHGVLDLKGTSTRLLQQNTHVVIPFVVSSRGYGFLWHNPAVGRADFAVNQTRWVAESAQQIDYWICAGDDVRDIVRQYVDLTGHAPEAPEWITGFWQSKLRYRTQEELVATAREHHRRGHPLSCIVIDFFHWTKHGEWRFDPAEWPDPAGMVADLAEIGVRPLVSIWPTVSPHAETYAEMRDRGYLVRTENGVPVVTPFPDKAPRGIHYLSYYDPTLEAARDYVWRLVEANYLAHGIEDFWLDSCEPEIRPNHPENLRLAMGNGAEVLNAYPLLHQAGFRKGLTEAGHGSGALLCRSAWAGSQKHGVILWSGDVWSTWEWFRSEIAAGLSAGLSGMAWWSSDIGGFYDGVGKDPAFRELLTRWFQFAVFSPICRLHGVRIPDALPLPADGVPDYGRSTFEVFTDTGGDNQIWSYGERLYEIFARLLEIRETLRPYLAELYAANSETGDPIMRPMVYDFPDDQEAARLETQYMLGPNLLVAPILEPDAGSRRVWLPEGNWVAPGNEAPLAGNRWVECAVTLETTVVFAREEARDLIAALPALRLD